MVQILIDKEKISLFPHQKKNIFAKSYVMKKMILLSLSTLILSTSCSEEKKELKTDKTTAQYDGVEVIVEGVFKENDKISVFYDQNLEKGNFSSDKKVEKMVYGSPVLQKFVFQVPEGEEPNGMLINFGINPNQKEITIKNISVAFQNDTINGDNGKFVDLFKYKNQLTYDENRFVFTIQGQEGAYNPYLSGMGDFREKLSKLLSNSSQEKDN